MVILQILLALFLYDIFKVFASKLFIVLVEMNIKRKKKEIMKRVLKEEEEN